MTVYVAFCDLDDAYTDDCLYESDYDCDCDYDYVLNYVYDGDPPIESTV